MDRTCRDDCFDVNQYLIIEDKRLLILKFGKKIKIWYTNSSIRQKFSVILMGCVILPIMFVQLINYISAARRTQSYVDTLHEANLQQTQSEIDGRMRGYYRLLADLSNNGLISENMEKISGWDAQYQLSQSILREELKHQIFNHPEILGIVLIANNREYVFYDRISLSALHSVCFDFPAILESSLIKLPQQSPDTQLLSTRIITTPHENQHTLLLSRSVSDFENLQRFPIGTAMLCIDEKALKTLYVSEQDTKDITLIMDDTGTVISSSQDALIGENIFRTSGEKPTNRQEIVNGHTENRVGNDSDDALVDAVRAFAKAQNIFESRQITVQHYTSEDGLYTVLKIEEENYILNRISAQGLMIIIVGISAILLAGWIINYTSNNIDDSVQTIINSMKMANSGKLNIQIQNEGKDEFAQISQSFNEMIWEMRKLIGKENEAQNRKRLAEIKALEAQINPHFLYNTLDSINWVAIENKEFEVSKMLKYLAVILRYSISNSNDIVTLGEELDSLKKYLYLQQNRFKYSFSCVIRASEELMNCRIHKLMLQPLIENCIEHGFPGETGEDLIEIDISLTADNKLQIVVSDNGVGISDDMIAELNAYDYESDDDQSSIGLRNVFARIKIYYRLGGSFQIIRNPHHGIRVVLTIDYEEEEK